MKKFTFLLSLTFFLAVQLTKAQSPADTIGAGRALQFNGNLGNYVDLGDVYKNLNFPFTFEAWIYPTDLQPNSSNPNDGIFATDNNPDAYYGFLIEIYGTTDPSPGSLFIDFGNGGGYGYQYRRGFYTNNPLPLNQWSHIAIECNSVTDVTFYVNGVVQAITADGGQSTSTTLTYSSSPANLGRRDIGGTEDNFIGQIDETRLWNIDLSQTEIQQSMCSKITGSPDGLIGYWKCDEADNSNTVNDYSGNGINGTITGTVTRVVSDAPLGNTSSYLYTGDWSGVSLDLGSTTGDTLIANQITGEPYGVQIYNVNSRPYDTTGLLYTTGNYFGVFAATSGSPTNYTATVHYSLNDGLIDLYNQDSATLKTRTDDSVGRWSALNGTLTTSNQSIVKTGQSSPQEYILNDRTSSTGINQLSVISEQLSVYPNPTNSSVFVKIKSSVLDVSDWTMELTDVLGRTLYTKPSLNYNNEIDLSDLPGGVYFITVVNKTDRGVFTLIKQ